MKKILFSAIAFFSIILTGCSKFNDHDISQPQVKNIIFFIGDGMGISHVNAAMYSVDYELNISKCDASGFVSTHSLSGKITDSAAGATAMATGHKTTNGTIAQDTLGNDLKSILKIAEENLLSTGLVATCDITHATPACFIANRQRRSSQDEIAEDFLKTDIDVIIGGGYNRFALREDSINYIDSLINHGYYIARNLEELKAADTEKLAGLLYEYAAPKYTDGRGDMLPQATAKALEILSKNENGFFVMIEGSQIDWGGHSNDGEYVVNEMLDLDHAIGVALDFQKSHPETLIVITADHETGGLSLPAGEKGYKYPEIKFSTTGHTAVNVPVFAFGPGSDLFTGMIDNTDFFYKFMELYSFDE